MRTRWKYALAGGLAGVANGFFGGGGGSVFVPLLTGYCKLDQRKAFATSVAVKIGRASCRERVSLAV